MKIFIDTEFNEWQGQLISMALVDEDGEEFYEVLECPNPGPWVAKHVMPILNKAPITKELFMWKLTNFLGQYKSIELYADWPDDIKYFCDTLITGPGEMVNLGYFTCVVDRQLSARGSKIPHNALEDARAIHESYLEKIIFENQKKENL